VTVANYSLRMGSRAGELFERAVGEHVISPPERNRFVQPAKHADLKMAGARESTREPGKSDRIDAVAVARAAIREGPEGLPPVNLRPCGVGRPLPSGHID
jgi:hypothetical protein